MKTHEFIEEMEELGYEVWRTINPMRIGITQEGEYKTLAKIDKGKVNNIDTTIDTEGLLSEDAMRLCFLYAQTPIEDREADYYYIKTSLGSADEYLFILAVDLNKELYKRRIIFTEDEEEAAIFSRKDATELRSEYPYLELEGVL